MTKFSHLSKNNSVKLKPKAKKFSLPGIDLKRVNLLIGAVIVVMGVVYLVQINALATKGYQIRELESQLAQLEEEKSDLELESLELQSMGSIKDKVADLGMVAVGQAEHLTITPVAVAR